MKDYISGRDPNAFPVTSSSKKGNLNELLNESHLSFSNLTQVK